MVLELMPYNIPRRFTIFLINFRKNIPPLQNIFSTGSMWCVKLPEKYPQSRLCLDFLCSSQAGFYFCLLPQTQHLIPSNSIRKKIEIP